MESRQGATAMLTHSSSRLDTVTIRRPEAVRSTTARSIMIVNGDDKALRLLDAVLEAGRYDVVFVESTAHAYSQIKRLQPDLVVVCTRLGEMDGFQVLSMLKLDEQTRAIPILTCTTEWEDADASEDQDEVEAAVEAAAAAPAGLPN
jgi:CheY-like chemotaxis protein